jgi:UDP-N-acetylmuramate dehydrogenase
MALSDALARTSFRELGTLRLGGAPSAVVVAESERELVEASRAAEESCEQLLVFGGASNLVVADAGFDGTALRVATSGVSRSRELDGRVRVKAAAGESWAQFVEACVSDGLSGVEAMAGIPGTVGATPIQNVGAYGQEVADSIREVHVYDRSLQETVSLSRPECGFGYRRSRFQVTPDRFLILGVDFVLTRSRESGEVANAELRKALDLGEGGTAPTSQVRDAVLALRREKGMVLDPADHDTWSVGSFFKNPILEPERFQALQARAQARDPGSQVRGQIQSDGRVRTPAAWLIQNAGFEKGYPLPQRADAPVALSTKHVLALTNRGSGTTRELLALAGEVARGVRTAFGIAFEPEPVFVGVGWDEDSAVGRSQRVLGEPSR